MRPAGEEEDLAPPDHIRARWKIGQSCRDKFSRVTRALDLAGEGQHVRRQSRTQKYRLLLDGSLGAMSSSAGRASGKQR